MVAPPSRPALTSTYRVQLGPDQGFPDVAARVPHLARLGVSHVYLSPVLQAAPGSTHGYDVVDHTRVSVDLGGEDALRALADVAHEHDLGLVADVVPNHMAFPTDTRLNAPLAAVLREGPESPYAEWFDVDWAAGPLLVPVLGTSLDDVLARGELDVDRGGEEPVLRYYEHVLPLRDGTAELPLPDLLSAQHYDLAHWREGAERLTYRRFFDVTSLLAVRVEVPEVFAATHEVLVRLHADGVLDGFRIDHPDGLADPRGYLAMLAEATGGAWVVVEKILEQEERLPDDWRCAGTTGYDALNRVLHVLVDPTGEAPLRRLWADASGDGRDLEQVVDDSQRLVATTSLRPEIARLARVAVRATRVAGPMGDPERLERALVELLVAFPRYRAYVVPGEPASPDAVELVEGAAARAAERAPDLAAELRHLTDLALGRLGRGPLQDEACVRFQQTCGPVMAKGVEDTAFYRYLPLSGLCEVGGWPSPMGWVPEQPPEGDAVAGLHAWAARQQAERPTGLTTLSTHDTKRSEDVRARLAVLSELPDQWAEAVERWRQAAAPYRSPALDGGTEHLVWQTFVGAWPITAERLVAYLAKATKEAKARTTWTDPDPAYDEAVRAYAEGVLADEALRAEVEALVERLAPATRVNVLGQKLLQLVLPGVPDVYQGTEAVLLALVDPDNRRPVDAAALDDPQACLDAGGPPATLGVEKLLVTSTALRLRRELPEEFGASGDYAPVETGTPHAVAFVRGERVLVVATRLAKGLARAGGWGDASLPLPAGVWTDALTEDVHEGDVRYADLLAALPVALLVRE